jgi:hypothetical protein
LAPGRLAPGHDAFIVPRSGQQLEIVFNEDRPKTRQNFSICHEICHTLFPDGYEMIRHRYNERERFDPDRELEFLCDVGAAEILLPEIEFSKHVDRFGFGLTSVDPLRELYQSSREATIRRMVQLHRGSAAAVFLEHRLKPSEVSDARQASFDGFATEPFRKLRIAYSVPSESFAIFLPADKSVPDDSCAYEAMTSGGPTTSIETWDIRGLPRCRVEAMSMPSGPEDDAPLKVVSLIAPLGEVA